MGTVYIHAASGNAKDFTSVLHKENSVSIERLFGFVWTKDFNKNSKQPLSTARASVVLQNPVCLSRGAASVL